MNVHAICDHTGRFIDVFVGYTGRCHDTTVLEASPFWLSLKSGRIGALMRQFGSVLHVGGRAVAVPLMMIADAAYTCRPFFLPA